MSDGGLGRASLGVWKSSQNVDAKRSTVRSIVWLGVAVAFTCDFARGQVEHETLAALVGDQETVAAALQGRDEHILHVLL